MHASTRPPSHGASSMARTRLPSLTTDLLLHQAPIPEEEPLPGEQPIPQDDPEPHPDPVIREPDAVPPAPLQVQPKR
jgi:hypothetical protein